jgi:hypothetical protein
MIGDQFVNPPDLGACPTSTVLLRRRIRDHLRCSRPEKILNVFQRIRLRFFRACGLASGRTSFASSRTAMSDRLLDTRKAAARMQSYRFQPKFRNVFLVFNMNMDRLFTITGVKEESIRTLSEYGRHRTPFRQPQPSPLQTQPGSGYIFGPLQSQPSSILLRCQCTQSV